MAEQQTELSSFLSSASLVFVGSILGSVAKMLERIIIGRSVSLEAYGEVSIGFAVLTISTTIALLGVVQGIPRFISRYDTEAEARGVWATGLAVTLAMSLVITAILFLTAGTLTEFVAQAESTWLLQLFVLTIPLTVGLRVGIGGIQGFENTRYRTLVRDVLDPGLRIALILVFLWLGYGALSAGYAYLIAAAVSFVAAHVLLNRLLTLRGSVVARPRQLMAFSAPLVVSSVLAMLMSQADTLMVGYFRSSSEVALYSAAYPIAVGLGSFLGIFNFLYLPVASRLDAQEEYEKITSVYALTTKWTFFLTFPAFLVFGLFPADVLGIFFGARYRAAAPALTILAAGYLSNAIFGQNLRTVSALGHTKFLMVTNGAALLVNIVVNLLLIPRFGYVGASVASAASYTAQNVVVNVILWSRFNITPFTESALRTYVPLLLLGPLIAFAVSQWVTLTLLTLLPALAAIGLLSIAVAAVTGGLQPEDREVVEFVERTIGHRVPLIRRYIPTKTDDTLSLL